MSEPIAEQGQGQVGGISASPTEQQAMVAQMLQTSVSKMTSLDKLMRGMSASAMTFYEADFPELMATMQRLASELEPSTYEPAAAPQEHNGQVRWDRLDLSIPELLPPDGNSYGGGAANSTPQPQREQVQSAHPGLISKPTPIPMPAPAQTSAMAEGNVHPDSTCDFKKQMLEHVTSSRVQLMLESAIDTSVPGGVALAPHMEQFLPRPPPRREPPVQPPPPSFEVEPKEAKPRKEKMSAANAERARRERINHAIDLLREMVPQVARVERAQVLEKTISHISDLEFKIKTLEYEKLMMTEKHSHELRLASVKASGGLEAELQTKPWEQLENLVDAKNQRVSVLRSALVPAETNGQVALQVLCKERRGLLQDILLKLGEFPLKINRATIESSNRACHNIFLLEMEAGLITPQRVKKLAMGVLSILDYSEDVGEKRPRFTYTEEEETD
mmetsp:Transcript_10484/g.38600  ORF Transcript_10484/g.38600 Transcript_10484/m.38600 type:complete len:446 (+) Transcript_10484:229-1566(+)